MHPFASIAVPKPVGKRTSTELSAALAQCKSAFWGVGLFSCLINVLMLTGPLFMLQVYDRVLSSRSVPTLVVLAVLVAALYLFQGLLIAIRGRVLLRIGASLDATLSGRVYDAVIACPCRLARARGCSRSAIWTSYALSSPAQARRPCSISLGCRSMWRFATCSILGSASRPPRGLRSCSCSR